LQRTEVALGTAADVGTHDALTEGHQCFWLRGNGGLRHIECNAGGREFRRLATVGSEPVVAHAHESLGKYVQQEAPDELVRVQSEYPLAIAVSIVAPAKAHVFSLSDCP
jgi:hypothetical protein